MENPITGETLTEAERVAVVARFAEAGRLWREAVAYVQTLDAPDATTDPHQRLMAIGVHIAQAAGGLVPRGTPPEQIPGMVVGLLTGTLAVAAQDGANAIRNLREVMP